MSFRIFIYSLISWLSAPLLGVVLLQRYLTKKRPYQILSAPTTKAKGSYYWIQAPSAGEVVLAKTLINRLETELPNSNWLIISNNFSGYSTAKQIMAEQAVILYFNFPLDFTFAIRRLIKRYPPLALIVVESNIRPNFVYQVSSKNNAKVILVNERAGPAFMKRSKCYWWIGYFMAACWKRIDLYIMKSLKDRAAFIAAGAPADRVVFIGNLKFDLEFPEIGVQERRRLLHELNLPESCRLIVAGSTHHGEEEIILEALQSIWEEDPEVFLLIAPRHLRRVPEVEALLKLKGLGYWMRSNPEPVSGARIIILDSYGELLSIYSLAKIAIIGNSFVEGGGHNVLEPLGYGSPVFFGPNMHLFQEIADRVITAGVGFQVADSQSLATECLRFLKDETLWRETAVKAKALIRENRGALQHTVDLILTTLGKQSQNKEATSN